MTSGVFARQLRNRRRERRDALRILEQLAAEFQDHRFHTRQQPRSLVVAEHHIQVLNRLARRALHEVVDDRHQKDAAAGGVDPPADVAEIRIRRVLDFGQRLAGEPHERRVPVAASIASATSRDVVPGRTRA